MAADGKGQINMPNNTYKGVRIVHEDYDLYYSAWCNNEHELYNLKVCVLECFLSRLVLTPFRRILDSWTTFTLEVRM